ncbi:DUF6653 family protein [Nocardia pseudobrasiliensis]|uniref:Uncharacterized protein n=1 Tax=Nocardia pseudobrasiliensis TaxID=45979 RepID=A0A370IF75_9NOCA|nr:DUF6653 family protein [Nocardia pseudobrasiliensis]RDI68104.1 hypothetical protein DFR76_102505 [Nocardia pseudobrasiliensis]
MSGSCDRLRGSPWPFATASGAQRPDRPDQRPVLLIWGLAALEIWPTVFGAALIVYGQLWRIDRLGIYYDQTRESPVGLGDFDADRHA